MGPVKISEDTVLWFGRHKGKSLIDVAETNPSYPLWMAQVGIAEVPLDILEGCWDSINEREADDLDRSWAPDMGGWDPSD